MEDIQAIEQLRSKYWYCLDNGRTTIHQGHSPHIEMTTDTTARWRWALNDIITGLQGESDSRGYGYYEDDYLKGEGSWRIKKQKLTYL